MRKINTKLFLYLSSKVYLACMQVPETGQPPRTLTKRPFSSKENHVYRFNISNLFSIQKSMRMQHLKLKWKKLESFANKVGGARTIFSELFGTCNTEETFWLDSSSIEKVCLKYKTLILCFLICWYDFFETCINIDSQIVKLLNSFTYNRNNLKLDEVSGQLAICYHVCSGF